MLCRHIITSSPLCAHVCARVRVRPLWVMLSSCSVPWETPQEKVCEQIRHLLLFFALLFQCLPVVGHALENCTFLVWVLAPNFQKSMVQLEQRTAMVAIRELENIISEKANLSCLA